MHSPSLPLQSLAIAEPLDGPLMQRYRQLAASLGLWLSLGGFQEQGPDSDHLYNCHVVIDDQGSIVASYRKVGGGRHEVRPREVGLPAGKPLPLEESHSGPRGVCLQLAAAPFHSNPMQKSTPRRSTCSMWMCPAGQC